MVFQWIWNHTVFWIPTHLKVQGITFSVTSSLDLSLIPKQPRSDYQKILMDFPTTTSPYIGNIEIKHDKTHHIETRGPPVHTKSWHLAPEQLKITKQEFQHMLELRIIKPSSSNWASPFHTVCKKTAGDWHPCVNYRTLNNGSVLDGTTTHEIMLQFQTGIPSRIWRTLQSHRMERLSFQSYIWFEHITKFPWTFRTCPKWQPSCHSGYSNLSECHLAYETRPRHLSVSWTRYYVAWHLPITTSMTC